MLTFVWFVVIASCLFEPTYFFSLLVGPFCGCLHAVVDRQSSCLVQRHLEWSIIPVPLIKLHQVLMNQTPLQRLHFLSKSVVNISQAPLEAIVGLLWPWRIAQQPCRPWPWASWWRFFERPWSIRQRRPCMFEGTSKALFHGTIGTKLPMPFQKDGWAQRCPDRSWEVLHRRGSLSADKKQQQTEEKATTATAAAYGVIMEWKDGRQNRFGAVCCDIALFTFFITGAPESFRDTRHSEIRTEILPRTHRRHLCPLSCRQQPSLFVVIERCKV